MIALPEFESFTLSSDDKSDRSSNWIFFLFLLIPKATQSKKKEVVAWAVRRGAVYKDIWER